MWQLGKRILYFVLVGKRSNDFIAVHQIGYDIAALDIDRIGMQGKPFTQLHDGRIDHFGPLQRARIDSLRQFTPGVPVVVEGDTLFYLYNKRTRYLTAKQMIRMANKLGI